MRTIPKKARWQRRQSRRRRPPAARTSALRTRGLRLTGPRRVVLEVVRGTDSHPTAERVHAMVRRRLPRVSLGTVYRNLRLLVAEGLVQRAARPSRALRRQPRATTTTSRASAAAGSPTWRAPIADPHSRALCRAGRRPVGAQRHAITASSSTAAVPPAGKRSGSRPGAGGAAGAPGADRARAKAGRPTEPSP